IAIARGRRSASTAGDAQLGRSVAAAGALTVVTLIALLFQSVVTGRALDSLRSPDALRIQVTGNQWWWDIQYLDAVPALRVATAPVTRDAQRGKEVVERGPCAMCHTISGTLAGGRTAPDLTHLASRRTIGAGSAPNTAGYLAGWIADPQHIKPGIRMPSPGLN